MKVSSVKKTLSAGLALFLGSSFALTALAAGTSYALYGDATAMGGGTVQLRSDADPGYGAIRLTQAEGLTFSELTSLSFDFNVTDDDCKGGSPRLSVGFDLDNNPATPNKNLFIYAGPMPNFTGCAPNTWLPTGNFVGSSEARFDASQLGGPWYGTYANALALVGDKAIARMSIVVDAGWGFPDGEQTLLVRNIVANGPTDIAQCKDGGWQAFGFKNQGQCVSSVASKNK